ncbi:zinc finger, RING-type domain containing protein [Rhodotorula toruloides]|uniref:Zinc finger, RING-type domain containing protein n=1 Tax=Rhodotorula toruloides TaxID=5286 RepID=A0A511KC54_RHOTO|nr:zinc finger, RING-type domain containing protein [Rhodotorula toruloides]
MRLSCAICHCSNSPQCPPARGGSDWVAVTDCGHTYHQSCLETWYRTANEKGCPMRCTYLNVKRDNPRRTLSSRLQEPLPLLTLYSTGEKDGLSSDPPGPGEQAIEPARKKRKLKARAVPDDETDEAQNEPEGSQDAVGVDEVTRLRNELREAMNMVREQRQALEGLRETVDELRERAEERRQPAQLLRPAYFGRYGHDDEEDDEADNPHLGSVGNRADWDRVELDWDERGNCRRCGVNQNVKEDVEALRSRIQHLEEELDLMIPADELARTEERFDELQRRHDEVLAKYNELDNDYRTEKIAWRDEKQKLMTQLRESGDSGQEMIKELQAEIDRREREILHINASIDGIRQVAQDQVQAAQRQWQRAETSASEARVAAKQSVREAEAKLKQEEEKRRRVEGANKRYEADLARLKKKMAELRAKRGIIATDSDAEDSPSANGPSTSFPSRHFKRTASSRSYRSPSPPAAGPTLKVNNNSKLLASPMKKRHERTPTDECEVSREYSDDENDELEYADEKTMRAAAREEQKLRDLGDEAPARPVRERNDDDSSDVEIVESSYFASSSAAKGKQKAPARPLSAHNSLPNASTSARLSTKQPSPFPSLIPAKTAAAPPKKQALAKSSSDKWLPNFASSQVVGTGPKRLVKRR